MFCEDMGEQLSFPPNALRDYLSELSKGSTFEPDEQDAWNKLKELFHAMNEGKRFRSRPINRFNGGLFADDPELDNLRIPNEAFCVKLQGENDATLKAHPLTLLYFSGAYNFGAGHREGQAITLYTLGRIFEQSITELEALEAQADQRPSLTIVSKRKRDGVYYTPEWVVERIVAETLGPRLDDIRAETGWNFELEGDEAALAAQIALPPSRRGAAFTKHADAVRSFRDRLDAFTVLDPACGSGAFLIYTLEYLLRERRRVQRELVLVTGGKGDELFEFKADEEIRNILSKNIFGVDINPASVELSRLALWLHTAKSDQPLSNLETNIVEGNSLVGSEVFDFKKDLLSASATKKETINAFDYEKRFSALFDPGRPGGPGFDCIVSNPPYVRIQNFKKVHPETEEFLRKSTVSAGRPRYQSCQTGNYDIYLPFIERGLELLNSQGRLGYIAPSVWRYNEYGEGLRKLVHAGGHLDRWIDFASYQVFDEAIIYTALQFYTRNRNNHIRFASAPTGEITRIHDWDDPEWYTSYDELPKNKKEAWIFVPRTERALLEKLAKSCKRLDDRTISRNIFVGLQTSADHIYHLKRLGKDRYQHQPPRPAGAKTKPEPEEVVIEDQLMHPLVAGPEVQRYELPKTDTYILFPYEVADGQAQLLAAKRLQNDYPKAWRYLKRFEKPLRARESNSFDDDEWYRFGRHQNIDKQDIAKILIPRLCLDLAAVNDRKGEFFIDNVDVGAVEVAHQVDPDFLTGILNCSVVNFVWKRIAKPFQNSYLAANKQFIAPLPIPAAEATDVAKVASLARELTELHTARRDAVLDLEKRLQACERREKPEEWLWPSQVLSLEGLLSKAPKQLSGRDKNRWAKDERSKQIDRAAEGLQTKMRVGATLRAELRKGELLLKDEDAVILDGVFVDPSEAGQIFLEWRNLLRHFIVTESTRAAELADKLRRVRVSASPAIATQIADLDAEIEKFDREIAGLEAAVDDMANRLYKLSPAETEMVENG